MSWNTKVTLMLSLQSELEINDLLKFPGTPLLIKNKTVMKKILIMTVIMTSVLMASCNVTRTITNQSEYYQRGDTSVLIQTKTIETYDATKR